MVCHQWDYFELPGEIASKDMRVIYAKNQELPTVEEILICPRCEFSLRYEEQLELFVCVACYHFQVVEADHLETTLKRITNGAAKTVRKAKSAVGAGAIAL